MKSIWQGEILNMRILKLLIHRFGKWYIKKICKSEYELQKPNEINERIVEYSFVFRSLLRVTANTVLDIGTGVSSLPYLLKYCGFMVTAIDNIHDYWTRGMFNRHFYVIDDDITNTHITKKFDFITCISVLEHIQNHETAVRSMFTLLNPGGCMVLTFPYNENKYIENVYKLPEAGYGQDAPYICQVYSRNELDKWLKMNNGKIIDQEYWKVFTGDFWTFGEQLHPPRQVDNHQEHHLTCILIKKV